MSVEVTDVSRRNVGPPATRLTTRFQLAFAAAAIRTRATVPLDKPSLLPSPSRRP